MNLDFSYYLAIFWRRFPYFAIVAVTVTSIGVAVALVMPAEYRATATLLVESQQIPRDLAPATVRTEAQELLQIIEQTLMTRENLYDTARRLDVFADSPEMSTSQQVAAMRERTTFAAVTGRGQANFFRVSFQGEDPDLVAQVTNEFVTLILSENVRIRTDLAGGTLEFFQEEVRQLGAELDAQSAAILKFKSENPNSLPENAQTLVARLSSLKDYVRSAEQQITSLETQKRNAITLFNATGSTSQGRQISSEQAELNLAQRALDDALAIYAPTHPRIAILRTRVAQAEQRLEGVANQADDAEVTTPVVSSSELVLNSQIEEIDRQIENLQTVIQRTNEEAADIEVWLAEIPANTLLLGNLDRVYSNTQQQYQQASNRLSTAATGERIELLSKGQRMVVLEQATKPEKPFKPNRTLITAAGLGGGISLGMGLVILLEVLNRSIRRPVEISDKLGIAPFSVLPYIQTESEARWRRAIMTLLIVGVLVGFPLLIWIVHSQFVALDPIAEKMLNRFGLSLTL